MVDEVASRRVEPAERAQTVRSGQKGFWLVLAQATGYDINGVRVPCSGLAT